MTAYNPNHSSKTLQQVLDEKPRPRVTVASTDTVFAALQLMSRHDLTAIAIVDGDALVGMFSERDYSRKFALHGRTKHTPMSDVITEKVVFARPLQTSDDALTIMLARNILHLPVIDYPQRFLGLISLQELVIETLAQQAFLIQQLEGYVAG